MPERLLQLDALRDIGNPEKIASLFRMLGYNAAAQPLYINDLQLSPRSAEAIYDAYMIADQGNGGLQVLLFHLKTDEWTSPSTASSRMKAIASQVGSRDTEFLLLATKDYDQLMLVNCRKSFDAQMNLKASIRKLLIDRTNPTAYDRDRLEEIAVRDRSPQELYQAQCEAFDVEKLTKQFYKGYKVVFDYTQRVIKQYNPHPYFDESDRLHQFSQRLLGRIMFLYFLQKKEFLGGDRKFLTNQYQRLKPNPDETNYYGEVLEPLFFDTLNRQRPNLESRWGLIPYLNGGLFDRDYGPGIKDAAGRETPETIELPNSLFDPGSTQSILGFFNGYNFTISENVQGDEDVAVDPEMLGKVFENMLVAEERGKSGTFYTPRGIVQFMCEEVLSRYLADESEIDLETIKQIINFDPDQPDSDFNKLMTSQQARKLKQALEDIKVLDPAVGSGAFPLGMMQVILSARQAIGRREGETIRRGSLAMSRLKRSIIANNLYGVDIKPEAIEIAKLRMWLSLVVDIPDIEDVEPLPNLDYKLMCGDSLISTIHGEQLIPDPTKTQQGMLAVTPIQQAIQPLLKLQHQYFDAQTEERYELRSQILAAEANVFRVAVVDRRQYWVGRQQDLERKITAMKGKVSKAQEKERVEIVAKLDELDKFALEVESGERSLNFFQYHLHFRDVFDEKGGFDVVIGNPPYVRQEAIKELKPALQTEYKCYTGRADLYIYFYEQGLKLLKQRGYLTYISSNKYFRATYGKQLRQYLGSKTKIEILIDLGNTPVFDAIAYPSILLLAKDEPKEHTTHILTWDTHKSINELNYVYKENNWRLEQKQLISDGWSLESVHVLKVIDKLNNSGIALSKYISGQFFRGVNTGFNEAFVVDRKTRNRLIDEDPSSLSVLKLYCRGKDLKRWCIDDSELWLLFIPWHFPLHNDASIQGASRKAEQALQQFYPAIYNHLLGFKKELSNRRNIEVGLKYEWYAMHRCAINYCQDFEQSKILLGRFMNQAKFAFDQNQIYHNDALYAISGANRYITAILNSLIGWWFLTNICTDLQNGYLQAYKGNLEQIPIPTAPEPDRLAIEALVQKCLDAQGQGVEQWEAEIDDRVAHLYGLTAEDMKIIRGE